MNSISDQKPDLAASFAAPVSPPSSSPSTEKVAGRLHSVALRTFIIITAAILASAGALAASYLAGLTIIPTLVIIGVGAFAVAGVATWALLDEVAPRFKTAPPGDNSTTPPSPLGTPPGTPPRTPPGSPPGTPPPAAGTSGTQGNGRPRPRANNCSFRAFLEGWGQTKLPPLIKTATDLRQESTDWIKDNYKGDATLKELLINDMRDWLLDHNSTENPETLIEVYLASSTGDEIVGPAHYYALSQMYDVKIIISGQKEDLLPTPLNPQAVIFFKNEDNHTTLDRVVDISLQNIDFLLGQISQLKKDSGSLPQMKLLLENPAIAAFEKYNPVLETPNPAIPTEKALGKIAYFRHLYEGLIKSVEFENDFCRWRIDETGVIKVADDGNCAFTAVLKSYQLFLPAFDGNLRAETVQWMKDNLEIKPKVARMVLNAMLGLYYAKIDKAKKDLRDFQQIHGAEEAKGAIAKERAVIKEKSAIVDNILFRLDLHDSALGVQIEEPLIKEYFQTISTPGVFASFAELEATAQMLNVRLEVYDHNKVSTNIFNAEAPAGTSTIHIITEKPPPGQQPNHFNTYSPE